MQSNNKPNFLVVGAAKSGTTSLFNYLTKHSDIYIPAVKECRFFSQLPKNYKGLGAEFFANNGITDERNYFELFSGYEDKVCGDISNDYLYYYEKSIKNILKYLGNKIKIVIILRNPIDRAYSNYMHHIRDGWENISFEKALDYENTRIIDNWGWSYHYINTGMYYCQVKAYLENFKKIKIYLFEDFKSKDYLLKDLFAFLEVNEDEELKDENEYNISGYPRNKFIHNFINNDNSIKDILKPMFKSILPNNTIQQIISIIKNKNLKKIAMENDTRQRLGNIFKDDVKKLSNLIQKDLSHWL